MAITFPRAFVHDLPVVGLSFHPQPMAELSPLRSGGQIAKNLGPTLRRAQLQSAPLTEEQYGDIRAWYETLLSYEGFLGYDVLRQYPRLYKGGWGDLEVGGSPFDGTCVLEDVTDAKEVDLSALPVGIGLRPGDWLAFGYGTDRRALHMVVDGGDADASGELTVEVRPHVRVGWAADATVDLYRATAKFLILPGSWSEQVGGNSYATVSFEAIQTL